MLDALAPILFIIGIYSLDAVCSSKNLGYKPECPAACSVEDRQKYQQEPQQDASQEQNTRSVVSVSVVSVQ